MASALDIGDQSQTYEGSQTKASRPIPSNTRPAITPIMGGSAWGGITNIWQSTPRSYQSSNNEGRQSSTSPHRNSSSNGLRNSSSASTALTHGQNSATNAMSAYRSVPSSLATNNPSMPRISAPLISPSRAKTYGQSNSSTGTSMPILSNAALLSGSAPDFEVRSPTSRRGAADRHDIESRFRRMNIDGVNEFVPAHRTTNNGQHSLENRFFDGQSTIPNGVGSSRGTHALQTSYDNIVSRQRSTVAVASERAFVPDTQVFNHVAGRDDEYSQLSYFSGSNMGMTPSDSSFYAQPLGSIHQGDVSAFRRNIHDESLAPRRSVTQPRDIVMADNDLANADRGFGRPSPAEPSLPHPLDMLHITDINSNAYMGNKAATPSTNHDFRISLSLDSVTPLTGSESQHSTSGSGPSTRASSQVVESRLKTCENGQVPGQDHTFFAPCNVPQVQYGLYTGYTPATTYSDAYMANHMTNFAGNGLQGDREEQEDPNKPVSPFLRDFKMTCKTKRYELKDVYNYIVEFSGDQHGSRFIQGKLETANSDEKEQVFAEIQTNAIQLMTDIFGNYVIQKLFEHGTQAQKKALANQMKGRVHYLTTQVYGCRVVQKALEHVLTDQQACLIKELEPHVLSTVENQNGNHVIQKAIERVASEHIQFIFDAHKGQIVRFAKQNYGCRVVQRMLEHGPTSVKRDILLELRDSIPALIVDQFGNYVMQHVIRNGDPADRASVVQLVQQQLLYYSMHKFASNVVEAAIECAEEHQRRELLRNLTCAGENGQSPVRDLIRDQYGNYVIQKVIRQLRGVELNSLIEQIKGHLHTLRRNSHGKQMSAMEKALAEASYAMGPGSLHRHPLQPRNGSLPRLTTLVPSSQSRYPYHGAQMSMSRMPIHEMRA